MFVAQQFTAEKTEFQKSLFGKIFDQIL